MGRDVLNISWRAAVFLSVVMIVVGVIGMARNGAAYLYFVAAGGLFAIWGRAAHRRG